MKGSAVSVHASTKTKPVVFDLFAGAGVFSYAFKSEGFDIQRAIELESVAAKTYARNVGDHVHVGDIKRVRPSGSCDVLIAGPPCQGFSTLGRQEKNDPRNKMSFEVLKWARSTTPKIVVIENVAAFLDSKIYSRVERDLMRLGFDVSSQVLNASDYGVPQVRNRSFVIASKVGMPTIRPAKRKAPFTVREAWEGLSARPDNENHHCVRKPTALARDRMRLIPRGGDRRDVMSKRPDLCPDSWWKLKCQVTDVWGRMKWDEPCNTLRTCLLNPSKGRYIHPSQHRVMTIREAARLHTIPDSWKFEGLPYQVARQIGNSVPVNLGRSVARSVFRAL